MIELIIITVVVIGILAFWLRRVVPPEFADVVVDRKSMRIYSGDTTVTSDGKPNPVYYAIPSCVPFIGVMVRRLPLKIIEIQVTDYETFAKGNPRFVVDASVYCKISNVAEAARRLPGTGKDRSGKNTYDFQENSRQLIVSAIRKTTASYTVEDVIGKREEIAKAIEAELAPDFSKWGIQLTNVSIVDIRDPKDKSSTVVQDISAKMEAGINANSRMEVANRMREAEIVEAETREVAEKRSIQADEQIAMRDQDRKMRVAEQERLAAEKEMEVYNVREVRRAEIDAQASVKKAEGEKRATIERANGEREQLKLVGEGNAQKIEYEGNAEANIIRVKMVAKADGIMAEAKAQKFQQENAIEIRKLDVALATAVAYAKALQAANIKFFGTGDTKSFIDMFTPQGGVNIAGMLSTLRETDSESFNTIKDKFGGIVDTMMADTKNLNISELIKKAEEAGINVEEFISKLNAPDEKKDGNV